MIHVVIKTNLLPCKGTDLIQDQAFGLFRTINRCVYFD